MTPASPFSTADSTARRMRAAKSLPVNGGGTGDQSSSLRTPSPSSLGDHSNCAHHPAGVIKAAPGQRANIPHEG